MDGVLQVVNALAFSALALAVTVRWRRQRDVPSGWLAATLGALGIATIVGLFLPDDPRGGAVTTLARVLLMLLVLYPFALYRFTASFESPPRWLNVLVLAATSVCMLATFAIPEIPAEGEEWPGWFQVYALAVVAQWSIVGGVAVTRLWSAGTGQPTVARRRMRVLAVGALLLIFAILPGAVPSEEEPTAVRVMTQLLPGIAALLFFTGFLPPPWLRTAWRRRETAALREAEVELMGVTTARGVADALLPHVARVFGSPGAVLVGGDGRPKVVHGITDMQAMELAVPLLNLDSGEPVVIEGDPTILALPLRDGWLVIPASPFTPFFGAEEMSLLVGLGVLTDIALERAELFEREQAARRAVEQMNNELETLVYGVSHDLKSPLITLLGYLEYLRNDHAAGLDEEGRFFLDRMAASADYMQALIHDLLELSRIGRVQTESADVDLGALVTEVAEATRARHDELELIVDPLPVVRMNPVRARQLLTNLIENAARHGGRGDVRVRVSARPAAPGWVEVSVTDDGVGIPADYRERVFGMFERLEARDASSTGTGMGLTVCRKIVEQVGGDIRVVPCDGGTDVRFTLPLASANVSGASKVGDHGEAPTGLGR